MIGQGFCSSMIRSFACGLGLSHGVFWALLIGLFALSLGGCEFSDRNVLGYSKGYKPLQPISYSHKIHAGELKLDCKYCHFGAESSERAGVPPVNICMNCHKLVRTDSPQIKKLTEYCAPDKDGKCTGSVPWVRIHNLPDFVNFPHSRHVDKGVACQTCHGPIQEMPEVYQYANLSMGFCVNCHRDYNSNPPADLKDKHLHAAIDCAVCHH